MSCEGSNGETFHTTVSITTLGEGDPVATSVDVPTGLLCTVTEGAHSGWTVDDASQDASPGETVSFTNTRYGSLQITKIANGAPAGTTFTISYDCTDGTNGTVNLGGGQSSTINDIVAGSSCSVTEGDQPLYDVQIETSPATIVAGQTVTVTVTNTRKTTSLTINKTAVGGTGTFTFDVSCTGGGESFTRNGVSITVSTDGATASATVTGVPTGLSCLVTERVPSGWSVDRATSNATAGGSVSFTNTLQPAPVVVAPAPEVEGVQESGRATGRLSTSCQGTVRVTMRNGTSSAVTYKVVVAKKVTRVRVKAESTRRYTTTGPNRSVAKLMLGSKVLAKKRVPGSCAVPEVLPATGLRQS
nr:DUF5979 domain-containing protein [Nocardioides piscis]